MPSTNTPSSTSQSIYVGDFMADLEKQNERKREARRSTTFQKSEPKDMKSLPYYRFFAYLAYEEDDLQPPVMYYGTILEAAQAIDDFLMGMYGFADYYMDPFSWIPCDWVEKNDSFEDFGSMEMFDVPGIAKKIGKKLEKAEKFKLECSDKGKSYFEITRVDE